MDQPTVAANQGRTPGADRTWRVLIFPGATEIAMELRQALMWQKEAILFSAGTGISSHAPFVFARHYEVPMVGETGWIERLSQIVKEQGITHIMPAHDDALLALAENAQRLGAKVVTSPVETCRIARSKAQTLRRLAGVVPTPRLYGSLEDVDVFPVFLKPDRGQGSQRVGVAADAETLRNLLLQDRDRLILEYLPGTEFTIDCFSDRDRGLLYAEGRERLRIRAGIAMESRFVDDPRFREYAERINATVPFHGAWFFQVKSDATGCLKLMEVAPRIGGTSALSRVQGVNLPLLSLYECERIPVSVVPRPGRVEIDRALVNRYRHDLTYKTIYIDFDDTLLVRGRVNPDMVRLLYQGLNRGVRLVLLTRHEGELSDLLRSCRLSDLFDQIVHICDGGSKADHVLERDAIFIDDSYAERMEVFRRTSVPAFDTSMIELLFDDRV
jgi:carbamoyl-phosphate synthase large subunit